MAAEADQIDLGQLNSLSRTVPLPVMGQLGLNIDLELPFDDKGRHKPTKLDGTISLDVSNVVLGPGDFKSPALKSLGGSVAVPKLRLANFGGSLVFAKRRATFENFKFGGPDVEGGVAGYLQLAKTWPRVGPRAHLRFKFSEAFLKANSAVKTILTTLPTIKRGTDKEGFTGFTVTGRMSKPSWRPRKSNPYAPRQKAKRAKKARDKAKTRAKSSKRTSSRVKGKTGPKKSVKSARDLKRTDRGSSPSPYKSKKAFPEPVGSTAPPGYPSGSSTPDYAKRPMAKADEEEDEEDDEEEEEEEEEEEDEEESGRSSDSGSKVAEEDEDEE